MRVHYKNTHEVVAAIRGMNLQVAKQYLSDVLDHKRVVPFRVHRQVGRTAQAKEFKATNGRWPEKSVKYILSLLKNAESNAEVKGLSVDRCFITHIQVNRAAQGRRRTFRAHGRITPYLSSHCHIELFITEKSDGVKKENDKKVIRLTKKQAARQKLAIGGGSN